MGIDTDTDYERVPRPVFVVGAERSGTTLFRLMLRQHQDVAEIGQFEYALSPLMHKNQMPTIEEAWRHWRADRVFADSGFHVEPNRDFAAVLDGFLRQRMTQSGGSLPVATVHWNFDQVLRVWPDARFIHVVRDPRAVARSVMNFGWAFDGWHAAQKWEQSERCWDRIIATVPESDRHEIRYADLIADADSTLREVCSFLGLPFDEAMIERYTATTDYSAPDPSRIHTWRAKMDPHDIELVEARLGPLLTDRGFEPVTTDPQVPTTMQLRYMKMVDKVKSFQHRAERFGTGHVLVHATARRLGLREIATRERLRMNDIERGQLLKA